MIKLPSLAFLAEAFWRALTRFPFSMAAAFTGTGAVLWMIEHTHSEPSEPVLRLFLTGLLGLSWTLALHIYAETNQWTLPRRLAVLGVGTALLAGYYFLLHPEARDFEPRELPRYLTLLAGAHLLVAVAPYLNNRPIDDFWEYNKQLFSNIVVGAVYTLILFAGLSLAILAVDQLFDLNIDNRIYGRLFVLLAGVFNTTYFLYHLPERHHFERSELAYNAVFKNLCQFLLIPIVGLYFLILYAYSAKILFTWTLPQGWVASLVIGFSVAGIFTYLLNYLLPAVHDTGILKAYRRWFWWVMLPMTVLLFVAIGRRLSDYGVTEERFAVATTGVWLLTMGLYFTLSKIDNIKFIPISLLIFGLLGAFGPYNAFYASKKSQLSQLQTLLEQQGMLENGKIKPAAAYTDNEANQRIVSVIYYLGRTDRLDALQPWLPLPLDSIVTESKYYWTRGTQLVEWMNLNRPGEDDGARHVYLDVRQPTFENLDIAGYTHAYACDIRREMPELPDSGRYFRLSADGLRLEWYEIGKPQTEPLLLSSFDLAPLNQLAASSGDSYLNIPVDSARVQLVSSRADLRLQLRSVNFAERKGRYQVEKLESLIFVRERRKK